MFGTHATMPLRHEGICAMPIKLRVGLAAILLVIFLSVIDARADPVVFNGGVSAAFDSGTFASVASLGPLTFTSVNHFSLLEGSENCNQCVPPVILGYLSLNGPLNEIPAGAHTLNLQLLFDDGVDPNPFILSGNLQVYFYTNGVNVLYPVGPPASFSIDGVQGQLYLSAYLDFLRVGGSVPVYSAGSIRQRNPPLPTPEPTTISLLGIGLASAAWLRQRHGRSRKR